MSNAKSSISKASSAGFTLIEISVVVAVSALLLATGIGLLNTWLAQMQLATNQQRMTAIQQALLNYEVQNNRLPCPSSFRSKTLDGIFGREVTPNCTPGSVNPNGNDTYAATGRSGFPVIIGAVPVRDLGLPDSYRTNPYGYMYTYAITKSEASTLDGLAGAIDVVDKTGTTVLSSAGTATWVLVDHGKDGKGAFTANLSATTLGAAAPGLACPAAGTTMDALNCSYTVSPVKFRAVPFSQVHGASWFDDSIVYNTTPAPNAQTCTTIYSTSAGGASGGYSMEGYDSGGGIGGDYCLFALVCIGTGVYTDDLTFGPYALPGFPGTSPTAIASCPNAGYNVVSGGCTQTYGVPENAAGTAITVTAGPTGNIYNGPIAYHDATHRGIYGADLNPYADHPPGAPPGTYPSTLPSTHAQIIMPPLSHPAINTTTGIQGWECNGSTSYGIYTQAYATCCTGGQ